MRYAESRLTPESQVTQTTPRERREVPRHIPAMGSHFVDQHNAGKAADKALAFVNRDREAKDVMYKMGFQHGWFKGLICGLLIGALSIAVLAVVVLGDVLSG